MPLKIDTHRSGIFTFQVGLELERIQPLIDKVNYGYRLFASLPILPDIASQLEKETLLASIHGTDTIEGGTLSEDEILQAIETSHPVSQATHQIRITNLADAYQFAENEAQKVFKKNQPFRVSEHFILSLHGLISRGIDDVRYKPSQYRDNPKGNITRVGDTEHGGVYKPPQAHIDIKQLMGELVNWINSEEVINLPSLIRAPLAHYYFERIHPFNDGNGRVGRLLEKTLLIASGDKYAGRGIDHYYLNHIDAYFSAFNMARKAEKLTPETCNHAFIEFVLKGFDITIERLHHRANKLMEQVLILAWLGKLLHDKAINQREYLILDHLAKQSTPINLAQLKKLAWYKAIYRRYSPATKSRDWAHLVNSDLIAQSEKGLISLNTFKA